MSKQWKEDQQFLLNSMKDYRTKIENKEDKEVRKITKAFAENLHQNTPELHHRSINSIFERLPYLDNLLAGALEKKDYQIKDQHLYGVCPRNNDKLNLSNTRHSYNGAMDVKLC